MKASDAARFLSSFTCNEGRAELFEDAALCFEQFNIAYLGGLRGGLVIHDMRQHRGELWLVTDNSGELHVEKINHPESLKVIPYEDEEGLLDGATLVYRIRRVLDGGTIDLTHRCPELLAGARRIRERGRW